MTRSAGTDFRLIILAAMLALVALEYGVGRLLHRRSHDWRESAATLGVALGRTLLRGVEAVVAAGPAAFLYRHRLLEFDPVGFSALASLFVATELVYYWYHRASHRIRWMWATHAVHHSPTRFNLTSAIRLGWTNALSGGFLFVLPLAWLGFHPVAIAAMFGLDLTYQFFLHTELVPSLGPLDYVLNTPAHHRVHHASNPACLDRNYGGMLILFDRLFGTFAAAPKHQSLRYGLAGAVASYNPVRIALGEWAAMAGEAWCAGSWSRRLRILFGPPGGLTGVEGSVGGAD